MTPDEYVQDIVAHYLEHHSFSKTLETFEIEANRKFNTARVEESLTSIVNDRVNFKELRDNAALNDNDDDSPVYTPQQIQLINDRLLQIPMWTVVKPTDKQELDILKDSLVIYSRYDRIKVDGADFNVGIFTTSGLSLCIYDLDANTLLMSNSGLHPSNPIKAVLCVPDTDIVLMCGMEGSLTVGRLVKDRDGLALVKLVEGIKLHKRLITSIDYISFSKNMGYLCSVGWDSKFVVHKVQLNEDNPAIIKLDEKSLRTKATCLLTMTDRESGLPVILVGSTDSSMISMFIISNSEKLVEVAKLSLNDSEFSSHSFQPMTLAQVGTNLVSVGTDHVPYLRVITIMIPSIRGVLKQNLPIIRNIIVSNLNSMTPQNKYSSPILLNRPDDKQGIWILGDDGTIRGFDLSTGKVVETLKTHKGRIKTAFVGTNSKHQEIIVSTGAMDRTIALWK
ncbi:hypothetical protein FOA43_001500 [Brettanomyces nanus]|uniref:LisH domain-containing protein n=1 Tax=Eeniella nana TaxID=13502 RepID=A0A875RYF1_EENNA|nr:uncharacterized protein FOA43_001500 [Brettanomyces nanus]QPG74176.1 hypothetical protein FOA43_001500 [Brettanomyces nanus]